MRILICVTQGKMGGAVNFVASLARGLRKMGMEVVIGFGEGNYLMEKLEGEEFPLVKFRWLKRTTNPLTNLLFALEMRHFLNKRKFHFLHLNSTNSLFGAIGAKLSRQKPKIIFTIHGLSVLDPNYRTPLKWLYSLVFRFLLSFVDMPVFICKENLERAKNEGWSRGIVIYNGIEPPRFLERDVARKFFEEKIRISLQDKFLIGTIGRLEYQKNFNFLISIFPEIIKIKPNAILVIVGDGDERKRLENLVQRLYLGGKVFLLGEIKEASLYMKAFDLFILPSRYEGLSIALIEALFAKIPVLASRVGGNEEIVGKGCVYEWDDKEELLEKIRNPQIPSKGKEVFKIEKMVQAYFDLLNSLR